MKLAVTRRQRTSVAAALALGALTSPGQASAQDASPFALVPPESAPVDCASLRAATDLARRRRHDVRWNPQAASEAEAGGYGEWADVLDVIKPGMVAILVPHIGARLGTGVTEVVVSWPWSVPLGPDENCRVRDRYRYEGLSRHRALFEPGLLLGPHVGGFVRPGYRYIVRAGGSDVGLGAGLGSTLERLTGSPWRASVSPEVLVHYGECCSPGYTTLALRYDRFLAGRERDAVTLSLGFTYF
ncbi:MAG: hypothetical protein EOO75_02145 [Myxococcales bacterium]|nr:MAG: hypothetical protein EOO75_02145 [Myxococcales bacterium]